MPDQRPWEGNRRRLRGGTLDEEGGTRRIAQELDLNEVTADDLERFGHLERAAAERLVAGRALRGRFASWRDVERVEGLSEAEIRRLRGAGFHF